MFSRSQFDSWPVSDACFILKRAEPVPLRSNEIFGY